MIRRDDSDQGATSDAITMSRPAVAPRDRLKDRYEVVAHIGSGGMADVYHGIDDLLLRDVAIKVLKPERVDEIMKRRVLREARATCAVDHPHMLRITDMGIAGEAPFLVSDLLHGHSLAEELRQAPLGRLDWRRVVRWMLPAMEALHRAHEAGLVHRDIKPENLFIHHRNGEEVLIVLDLGLVKHVALDGTPSRWTRSGIILGTALYMSPEQGNAGHIDRRTDVYAMGVTLYRLISGQHLFPSPTGHGPIAAITKHLFEPPPRLAGREFPPTLVAALHTAVAKDPDQRHASMAEFAALLAACLTAEETRAAAAKRLRHHAGVVALGAALTFLAMQALRAGAPAPVTEDPPASTDDATTSPARRDEPSAPPPDPFERDALASSPAPLDDEPPAATAPPRTPQVTRRRRGPSDDLSRADDAVQQCMHTHGSDTRSLTVQVAVDGDGRAASTTFVGPYAASFLGRCVRDRIAELRFAPGPPRTLEHTYRFTPKHSKKESP